MARDIVEVLLSQIKVNAAGCFEWQGFRNKQGYGMVGHLGKRQGAHRVSFGVFRMVIPAGLQVCHKCDNPCCINPSHLFLGTQKDNMQDAISKKRLPRGEMKPCRKLGEKEVVEMSHLYNSGFSVRSLAKQFGVSHETARNILAKRMWQSVERQDCNVTKFRPCKERQGEKHPRAKLNEETVRMIRREVALGCRPVDMARVYGVSASTISSVAAKRYWSHVED